MVVDSFNEGMLQSCLYMGGIHQAIGNSRNGSEISGTRLDQQTQISDMSDDQTYLYDNIQLYIYPAKYITWDIQK